MSNVLARARKLLRNAQRGQRIKLNGHQRQRANELISKRDSIVEQLKSCDLEMKNYFSAIVDGKGFEDNYRLDRNTMSLVRIEEDPK